MTYPEDPKTPAEALQTLAEFASTAPGSLPTRVTEALRIAAEAKADAEVADAEVAKADPDDTCEDMTAVGFMLDLDAKEGVIALLADVCDRIRAAHGEGCPCIDCKETVRAMKILDGDVAARIKDRQALRAECKALKLVLSDLSSSIDGLLMYEDEAIATFAERKDPGPNVMTGPRKWLARIRAGRKNVKSAWLKPWED